MRLFTCLFVLLLTTAHTEEFTQLERRVVDALKNSWCSKAKAELILKCIAQHRPKICVEIGAFTGSSALPMLAALQYLGEGRAYIIDAWSNEEAIRGLPEGDANRAWWASLDMPAVRGQFMQTMSAWAFKPYFEVLPMSSQEAVASLPPIDFLHIDGNFSEEGALLDSELYLPKVVPGGHILLSNVLVMIGKKPVKMKALKPLFAQCEIVAEIENGNALLFRKRA